MTASLCAYRWRLNPRPVVHGVQTALVTGRADDQQDDSQSGPQAIHTYRDGRIRLQFHWQRGSRASAAAAGASPAHHLGQDNAPTNEQCGAWVRVMQAQAGASGNAPAWFASDGNINPDPQQPQGHRHDAVLLGYKSQQLDTSATGTGGYNHLVVDNTPGQARAELTSSADAHMHQASRLQLGHLLHQDDNQRLKPQAARPRSGGGYAALGRHPRWLGPTHQRSGAERAATLGRAQTGADGTAAFKAGMKVLTGPKAAPTASAVFSSSLKIQSNYDRAFVAKWGGTDFAAKNKRYRITDGCGVVLAQGRTNEKGETALMVSQMPAQVKVQILGD